jgi:hypothetical protein
VSVRIRLRILMSDVLVALARAVRPDEPASRVVDREPRHQDERAEASRDAGPSAQPAVPGPVVDGGPPAHWVELVRARAPDLLRPSAAGREHAIRTSAPAPPGAGSTRRAPNAAAATTSAPVARPARCGCGRATLPRRAAPRRSRDVAGESVERRARGDEGDARAERRAPARARAERRAPAREPAGRRAATARSVGGRAERAPVASHRAVARGTGRRSRGHAEGSGIGSADTRADEGPGCPARYRVAVDVDGERRGHVARSRPFASRRGSLRDRPCAARGQRR